jgi:hypothetical protein
MVSKEEQAKAQRDGNMDNEEQNVTMLNISIQEENVNNDRLAEENRKPMARFWASWDQTVCQEPHGEKAEGGDGKCVERGGQGV